MPALPPVPNVIRVIFHWGLEADNAAQTRRYFSYTGGAPSTGDCNALAADIDTAGGASFPSILSNAYQLSSVVVQDLASTSGAEGISSGAHGGTRAGTPTPVNTGTLTNWLIPRRYRGGKPRSYFPFLVAGDLVNNQAYTTASTTAVDTALGTFVAAVIGATSGSTVIAAHVNVSYYEGFTNVPYGSPTKYRRTPTLRPGGPLVDVIATHQTSSKPGTQRRRFQR
jgi:hypothetical protein